MCLRAAKAPTGPLRRATVAVVASRRLPCGARVAGLPQNSLRSLRSLRSNSCGKSDNDTRLSFGRRAAGDAPLLGATEPRRSGPVGVFAGMRCAGFSNTSTKHQTRRTPQRVRYSDQPQRFLRGRWSADRAISGAASTAAESARSDDRPSMSPGRRPPSAARMPAPLHRLKDRNEAQFRDFLNASP